MKKIILRDLAIVIMAGAIIVLGFPILAEETNKKGIEVDDYLKVIDVLPDNTVVAPTVGLPEIEVKPEAKKIVIDLSEQKLYTYEDKKLAGEYLVSTGKRGMETPIGEFKVYEKRLRAWSKMAGLWMPFWMLIDPKRGVGIHELPEWPNGYKEGANHLGTPVSHGCVRLGVGAAETVYNWAEIGTVVIIQK
jgi:lipoprotein-anchoring transpeptidase ErfK/SrfK